MSDAIELFKQELIEQTNRKIALLDDIAASHAATQALINEHEAKYAELDKLGLPRTHLTKFQLKLGTPTTRKRSTQRAKTTPAATPTPETHQ